MTPTLRPYQSELAGDVAQLWQAGARNVLAVMPTGSGKTVLFSHKLAQYQGASVAVAHRQELVSQISLSLARFGLRHRIIGPRSVVKLILEMQGDELGETFYDPNAPAAVAGVDTLIRRNNLDRWAQQVGLWVQDEAHHVLIDNKWGKAAALFPSAYGLGVTATPERADGRGLGAHADGLFHAIVEGPSMRELIVMGNLCDYRIFAPPSDIDISGVAIAKDGDFNRGQLREAARKSHIVGDVVGQYLKIARGKLGITFATDVETATEIAAKYNASGVRAEIVCAKTPDRVRNELIQRFRRHELDQLVNVDLFGEGFDLPAIEVVSMARPTQSFTVFAQQFGRALRPLEGKADGIIIDHVGNVVRHRLPDAVRAWTLNARSRGARAARDPDVVPVSTCTACFRVYESLRKSCPFCGHIEEPRGRSRPEQVDGDLLELTPAALAELRGEVAAVDVPQGEIAAAYIGEGCSPKIAYVNAARHRRRQEAQAPLRDAIAMWAGYQRHEGRPDSESYRRFYHRFGVDVMSAQTLGRRDAEKLTETIRSCLS